MTPRSIEVRCVHVGDVLVRKVCPAVGARPVGDATDALGDLDYDIHAVLRDADEDPFPPSSGGESIESHRKERVTAEPAPDPGEPDYEGTVLVHEP
jgi:hypothetical protein